MQKTTRSVVKLMAAVLCVGCCVGGAFAQMTWPYVDVAPTAGVDYAGTVGTPFPPPPGYLGDSQAVRIVHQTNGQGAAVGDYDNDGDLDIYLCRYEGIANVLLRNNLDQGLKSFTNVTAAAGVGDPGLGRVALFADLDNDDDLDLVVVNDNDAAGSHPPSRVYRNNGDGTFTDMTAGSGFASLGYIVGGAAVADYDGDGLLDLYVVYWTHDFGPFSNFPGSNRLFRNLGNFTFDDVTTSVGLGGQVMNSYATVFTDLNGDHRPDIYIAVDGWANVLYWNTPGGFVAAASSVNAGHAGNDMGIAVGDFDNDGDLDLYTTNITGPNFGSSQYNCFYRNRAVEDGVVTFQNIAGSLGVRDTHWGWGTTFTDCDNDGDLDLVAVNGFDSFIAHYMGTGHALHGTPTVLFVNDGGAFTRLPGPDDDDSRALIAFDYDRDGDEDLLVTNINGPVRLWENTTATGHWLYVAVRQHTGNRQGIGATVFVTVNGMTQMRRIMAGESLLSCRPAEVHFGLGGAMSVDELRVRWTDGTERVLTDVAADQLLVIEQVCTGDVVVNGRVDVFDLLELLAGWGSDGAGADIEQPTDVVDVFDLLALLQAWGEC